MGHDSLGPLPAMPQDIRKAAVLLMSLPDDLAAQLLGKLEPKQVEAVSIEIAKLGAVTGDEQEGALVAAMTQVYLEGALTRLEAAAKKVVAAVAEGDMLRTQMAIVRRLAKHEPVNVIALQEKIAARVLETGRYVTA